jgi:hypothetical protein
MNLWCKIPDSFLFTSNGKHFIHIYLGRFSSTENFMVNLISMWCKLQVINHRIHIFYWNETNKLNICIIKLVKYFGIHNKIVHMRTNFWSLLIILLIDTFVRLLMLNNVCTDCIDRGKYNYHTIVSTTASDHVSDSR